MTDSTQSKALRMALDLEALDLDDIAAELRRQHARIADLEAQLSAIGAGGLEPLRPRQCLHDISEPSGWQPIETAPEGQMVVVGWFDPEDHDTPERHDFDSLEDGCWQKWHEHAEYVEVIGGHGVSYTAPYTSWMPVPAIPSTSSADDGGSNEH